jgi:O-antigen/teichoic acid export membrane protein
MVLFFGVILTVLAIVLNFIFIPIYGIDGSAVATFLAVIAYNTIKMLFVKQKLNIQPFSRSTLKIGLLLLILILAMYFWEFPFHPLVNISLKSVLIFTVYIILVLKLNVSEDISMQIRKYLRL